MRIILNIAGTLLLVLLPGASRPQEAPAAGSPGVARESAPEHGKAFTGDATPVEPGRVEVEVDYAPTWWATAGSIDPLTGEQHLMVAAVTLGIVRDLDARVMVGWVLAHAMPNMPGGPAYGQGLADTIVATRWRFLSLPDPAIDLAVSAALVIPTGVTAATEQLATGKGSWRVGGAFLASADWGRFTAGLELGLTAPVGPRVSNDAGFLVCNAALGYQVLPWLQPEVELNYQHEIELGGEFDERVLWVTAALVFPLDPVRIIAGARTPVWVRDTFAGPTMTAAVKIAF